MATLPNFPMLNQLDKSDTTDGRPAENSLYDCVPTCVAAMMQYATRRHFSPDALKDSAYGENWVNAGTAASAFVSYAQAQGVKLYAIDGDVIALAHKLIQGGQPALFTRDDPYSSNPGDSHVSVWYGEEPGTLTALDPWGAQSLTMSDEQWRSHLWNNEVWTVEHMSGVPSGWHDDGHTLTGPNGEGPVVLGFRDNILQSEWDAGNVPQGREYHVPEVQLHGSFGPGEIQIYRDGMHWWTPAKGVVYEHYLGLEIAACYKRIGELQAALDGVKNTPPPSPPPDVKSTVQTAIQELSKLL